MDVSLWVPALALLLGLYMAWNIGANDVANAMGTSVGSRALTLSQAVLIAALLEFAGAFFVGSRVSETIQGGIVHPHFFASDPLLFLIGMFSSLIATSLLLHIASYFALPISTTHAIVGSVLGFGWLLGGAAAIQWDTVGSIALSWIVSPLLSGLFAYLLFRCIQKKILLAENPLASTQKFAPVFLFLCFFISSLSFLYQGLFALEVSLQSALPLSASVGMIAATIGRKKLQKMGQDPWSVAVRIPLDPKLPATPEHHLFVDRIFISLQVVSACMVAFAHGANDVANAIGPTAAILSTLQTGALPSIPTIPPWLLLVGAGGIVLGLSTWGWRVIETIGKKITELTPARGFAAEFSAATIILSASKLGLPISTTHALVGALCGVGLARGAKSLNWGLLKEITLSWVVTIPLCALFSVLLFTILHATLQMFW